MNPKLKADLEWVRAMAARLANSPDEKLESFLAEGFRQQAEDPIPPERWMEFYALAQWLLSRELRKSTKTT